MLVAQLCRYQRHKLVSFLVRTDENLFLIFFFRIIYSFVSTLLTAVLTNHLGWVGSVAPVTNSTSSSKGSSNAQQKRSKITEISKTHPYNALWAQLGDLYGAIGNPPRITKTIVCGQERVAVDKVLNVLTYFIRCGEIRRGHESECMEQDLIHKLMTNGSTNGGMNGQSNDDHSNGHSTNTEVETGKAKGLTRSATCLKDLTNGMHSLLVGCEEDKSKMNDIPNVLAFRDSHFVKQELRIGNFLMDTGIEMNAQQRQFAKRYQVKKTTGEAIKLVVTSPDDGEFECEAADEAIDYVLRQKGDDKSMLSLSDLITANSIGGKGSKLLWGIEPVREGISIEEWQHIEKDGRFEPLNRSKADLKRSQSLYTKSGKVSGKRRFLKKLKPAQNVDGNEVELESVDGLEITEDITEESEQDEDTKNIETKGMRSHPSLSDLITANSVGASDRLTWGFERGKESTLTTEEVEHFELAQKRIEKEHSLRCGSNVVFVLGDNDVLTGLKNGSKSDSGDESMTLDMEQYPQPSPSPSIITNGLITTQSTTPTDTATSTTTAFTSSSSFPSPPSPPKVEKPNKHCSHKKHSGVKFNFEQYPQIVTNYMKNKNLEMTGYDFLEKGFKLNHDTPFNYGASTSVLSPIINEVDKDGDDEETCECCANATRILQTPSNATELEFSSDDNNYPTYPTRSETTTTTTTATAKAAATITTSTTLATTSKRSHPETINEETVEVQGDQSGILAKQLDSKQIIEISKKETRKRPDHVKIINLPIPKSKPCDTEKQIKISRRPGFVPSLFVGVTDHYIPDMVLQVSLIRQRIHCNDFKCLV